MDNGEITVVDRKKAIIITSGGKNIAPSEIENALKDTEANAAGINGRKLKLLTEDDGYVTARTLQGLRKLIDVDKVFAITGISGTGQSTAAMQVLEKAGIPTIISVAPAAAQFEPPRKNVFVVGQVYEEGINQLTRYLADKNPGKKWAIVTQDDDYGLAVREGFDKAAKDKNITIVY